MVGSEQETHDLSLGNEPDPDKHIKFLVEVLSKNEGATIDRLIITLIPRSTLINFNAWYHDNLQDADWLDELVNLYASFDIQQLPDGHYRRTDRNCQPFLYSEPGITETRMHPNGYFEIRSYQTAGGHGNQAIFDEDGKLLTENDGINAGSADKAAPFPHFINHGNFDVKPYIWALQLDGSPSNQDSTTLTAPIMHEGDFLWKYLNVRPSRGNTKPVLADGATP